MAIGDTVQAGLMRVDSSAIERAGQAQAMANRAFGDALTTAAKGFFEGQAKKKKIEATKAGLQQLFPDAPEALINSMARNPEVMRTKMALENQAIQRSQIASAAASAGAARAQEAAKMEEDRRRFDLGQDKIKKAEESATNVAKFDLTRPVLPITEETPVAFLPELDPDPFAPPPTTYQGQAPAVAQLPKSFQPQAAKVVDAVQSGQLSLLEGNQIMDSIRGQAMAEQKAAPSLKDILDIQGKTQDIEFKNTEFQQKQDAISFKPERNYLDLGEVRFGISGKYANETEVAKIKSDVLPDYSNMNAITEQLIKMGEDIEGDFFVSPSDKVLAESLKSSLQGLIREDILGPGTVNDSERAILEQVIENPVEYFNVKRNRRDKINSLKGLRKKAFNKLKTRFNGLGLDVTELGQGGNASRSNKSPNMQNQTNRGLGYEEISLDDL